METFDDIVIGAGIIGLAHARALSERGRKVLVIERSERAHGASVRNFGMVWPMGQPSGERLLLALRSRALWTETMTAAGLSFDPVGSLHVAYHSEELEVLREFAATATAPGQDARLVSADEACEMSPRLRRDGMLGALYSSTETCVDPREAVTGVARWLAQERGVQFRFGMAATAINDGNVVVGDTELAADRVWLCSGNDLSTLRGELMQSFGLRQCKLQMMRTAPLPGRERIGPMLAAGLTLAHYTSFAGCPSLPALRNALAQRNPGYFERGIHVMVSQNARGELTIGDSHEYDDAIEPFDKAEIDEMILSYLANFFELRDQPIIERWHGIYAKHPTEPWVIRHPEPRLTIVTGLGGAGMTFSFGLGERVVREVLD